MVLAAEDPVAVVPAAADGVVAVPEALEDLVVSVVDSEAAAAA